MTRAEFEKKHKSNLLKGFDDLDGKDLWKEFSEDLTALLAHERRNQEKMTVPRFILNPTTSFPDGAPQRESYDNDATYFRAERKYDEEWRAEYECEGCGDFGCPQCGQRKQTTRDEALALARATFPDYKIRWTDCQHHFDGVETAFDVFGVAVKDQRDFLRRARDIQEKFKVTLGSRCMFVFRNIPVPEELK